MASMSAEEEATLLERFERSEKQLVASKTRIKNLKAMLDAKLPMMTKRLHRQVLGLLHPDRALDDEAMRKKMEKCLQEFSVIKFKFPDNE